ncbi:MAG: DUF4019 domain-containing protein [Pseudomonadota bacterium]|nr:DUF4019 domain-containing protein [Pseudomonadota bacterium]
MKLIANLTIMASLFLATTAFAQEPEAVQQAQHAADRWLALVDAGDYAQSWDQGASAFQAAVSRPAWMSAVQSARAPFGIMKARTLKVASYKKSLPGAPAGEYVVIQYSSQFANNANAIETVTPMLDKDGTWKVSGYFIK